MGWGGRPQRSSSIVTKGPCDDHSLPLLMLTLITRLSSVSTIKLLFFPAMHTVLFRRKSLCTPHR